MKTQVETRHASAARNAAEHRADGVLQRSEVYPAELAQKLQRSEFYLSEGQRLAHTGSWTFNAAGFDYWSSELFRIHGLAPSGKAPTVEEYLGLVHPEDRAFVSETIQKLFAEGRGFDFTKRIVRPDGEIRRVRCVGAPVTREGTFQEFIGTGMDVTEQEELTQELRRSEAYLADAQKLSHTGSFAWSPEAGIKYWSEECYRVLGFDLCDGLPRFEELFQRVHPDDKGEYQEVLQWAIREKLDIKIEYRLVHPDGTVRNIQSTGHPVLGPSGDLIEIIGTVIDITDRKRAEESIRRSEALLAAGQRISHTGSFGWDVSSGEIYWSDETYRIFEFDPKTEITTELIVQRAHPDDRQTVQQIIDRASNELTEFALEHRLLMPDGSIKHVQVVGRPSTDEGCRSEFVGAVTDITSHRRAEESLRRSEAYLADAQKLSRTGSWAWHPEAGITYWSEESYRVQGFDPREGLPTAEQFFQRIHPDDQPGMMELMQRLSRENVAIETNFRIVLPGGAVRDIHSTCRPVFNPSGDFIEFIGTMIDVTERKRAEALLTGEKRLHEMIATGVPLKETLNALCLMIEDQRGSTLASVLLLSPDGIHLESLAGPSLPEGWTQQIASLPIGPCAGSCGTAAYRGSPVIVSDIATDPLWAVADYRASALGYGLRASWSYPILSSGGKVLGTFCLYYREPRSPSPGDLDLIELAAHLARVAIECKVAEEQLRRSEALLAEGQRLSHTGSWGWKPATGEMTSSKERFRIFGLDPEKTKPSFEVFWERVHPEDREKLKQTFDTATREKKDFESEYRIVTPDWVIKHVHSVGHAILNESGELVEFIGATMDITGRKRAEERAQSNNEAIRLALNAFVEELDLDRFLSNLMTGLTKQFQATSCELWLFDDLIGATSLHLVYQQGRMIGAKTVGLKTGGLPTTWQPSNAGRFPRIIEIPDQASLLQPTHLELLKDQGVKTLMAVPLVLGEQNLGVVELRFQEATKFTRSDLDLAQALVHHATLALQLSRLAHRTEQMAVTEERNRMAREIHDTLAQAFAGVVLHSEALDTALGVNKLRSKRALSNIQKLARSGLEEARRSVQALRPRALEGSTLSQALEQMAKRYSEGAKFTCDFKQQGAALMLLAEVQNELFRIAQEAMTNINKHAHAKSVWITLEFKVDQAILTVRDDGIGFAATDSPKTKGGYGLSTMRERAQRIGSQIEIKSTTGGGGTAIRVLVPLTVKEKPSSQRI
jgi:PAS domain S-box-containing protein